MINILFFVQICFELLPISSSGHIELFYLLYPNYPNLSEVLYIFSHLFTACIMLCFLKNFFKKWLTLFSTKRQLLDIVLLSICLLITSAFLLIKKYYIFTIPLWYGFTTTTFCLFTLYSITFNEEREYVTIYDAIILGITQGIAGCIPGLSRFAMTLLTCQALGYTKKYSFTIASLLGVILSFLANFFLALTHQSYFLELYNCFLSLSCNDICLFILSLFFALIAYFTFIESYFNKTIYYISIYEFIIAIISFLVYVL